MDRREFLRRLALSSILAGIGAVGIFELADKINRGTLGNLSVTTAVVPQGQTQIGTQSAPSGYVLVTSVSNLAGKSSAYFNHPKYGLSILVNYGSWRAFSAVCTHAGCTVNLSGSSLYCPCHNGYFSASNGSVQGGPPSTPLTEFAVQVIGGNLYVSAA